MTVTRISRTSAHQIADPFVLLFSLTLFLSAALTFTIQPMIGKMLLPLVGGAPSGWLVTMVYFQVALLAGYAIAHALSRTTVLRHVAVIGVLLLCGIVSFPLYLRPGLIETPGLPEALGAFITLALGLSFPCVALFTLSPSLQRLFKASSARKVRDPYFLFAASNYGSLGGLLSYPLLIERVSGLSLQTGTWEMGYLLLIALFALCAGISLRQIEKSPKARAKAVSIDWKTRGWWVLLAFIPSSLMLGVTAHITTDTGTVPFFWVLPLALYLLTFILAFAQRQWLSLANIDLMQTAGIALLMVFFIKTPALVSAPEDMLFPVFAFFLTALFCHFTLAAARPPAQRLTEFYLWVAIGGALGGIFNTLIAPFLFPLPIEFIAVALLSCLIHPARPKLKQKKIRRLLIAAALVAVPASVICGTGIFYDDRYHIYEIIASAFLTMAFLIMSYSPKLLAGMSLIFGLFALYAHNAHLLDVRRDFFGVLRVFDVEDPDANITVRVLHHGSTRHGQEQVAPEIDTRPNGYYAGGLSDLFAFHPPANVGIVGMGAATIVCFEAPNRHFTFYEIDPAVPPLAEKWFDYTRVCGEPKILIGDGRRLLAATQHPQHDMLIVDAFTSDAIPVHLLTQEAFRIYLSRLKPNGLLAIHISNRFYDLRYPVSDVVASLGLHALYKVTIPPKKPLAIANMWVVAARDADVLAPLLRKGWTELPPPEGRPWTDDFSDTLSALKIMHSGDEETNAAAH